MFIIRGVAKESVSLCSDSLGIANTFTGPDSWTGEQDKTSRIAPARLTTARFKICRILAHQHAALM